MTASVRLPGSGSSRINTPDIASLSFLGDLDVRCLVSLDDWTPAGAQALLSHWLATGNQRSWLLRVDAAGTLSFLWSADGTATVTALSTAGTGRTNGLHLWVRVTHDVDNGATGNDVKFYTSTEAVTTAAASVTWAQLGTTVTTAAVTTHHNSTTLPVIGAIDGGASSKMIGNVFYTEWRDAADAIQGSPDFRDPAQTSDNGLTFVDPQTRVWTLQSTAVWVPDVVAGGPRNRLLLGVG